MPARDSVPNYLLQKGCRKRGNKLFMSKNWEQRLVTPLGKTKKAKSQGEARRRSDYQTIRKARILELTREEQRREMARRMKKEEGKVDCCVVEGDAEDDLFFELHQLRDHLLRQQRPQLAHCPTPRQGTRRRRAVAAAEAKGGGSAVGRGILKV